jgi:Fe-S cluster biogenesis protein NfuA
MLNLREKIEVVLDDYVRPILAMHKGNIEIVELNEGSGSVYLKFRGTCSGCPITSITFLNTVEKHLLEEIPELNEVFDIDNPSNEL